MTHRTPTEAFPPGEFIKEELEARGWSQIDFAKILGRTPQDVSLLVSGKRGVGPEIAQALADAFGTSAELWTNLESAYKLALSRGHDVDIVRRAKLFEKAPIGEMIRRGWIVETDDITRLEKSVLSFFEISALDEQPKLGTAARKSTTYNETTSAQWAWLYRAKQLAESVDIKPFSRKQFPKVLDELRALTAAAEEARNVPKVLADGGIRFVVVERLAGTKIDGATLWLGANRPVVALSLRFDRIDAFWHTLTHELGHVDEKGPDVQVDVDLVGSERSMGERPESELRADKFACNLLVPQADLDDFISRIRPLYSKVRINQFANIAGVHPGIIVGQLQHRGEISYQHSREMLVKIRRIVTSTAITDGWGSVADLSAR